MAAQGIVLLKNESATSVGAVWVGGRSALVLTGTLATTTKLQLLGQDGTTWLDVSTPTTQGVTPLDLPAGTYRMSLTGGSPALYASIVTIPYM